MNGVTPGRAASSLRRALTLLVAAVWAVAVFPGDAHPLVWSVQWFMPVFAPVAGLIGLAWLSVWRPSARSFLGQTPLLCFALFLACGVVSAALSDAPTAALRFHAMHVALFVAALAMAAALSSALVLRLYEQALAAAVVLSVACHVTGLLPGFMVVEGAVPRFAGLYGHPNPMAWAAAVYLLLQLGRCAGEANAVRSRAGIAWSVLAAGCALWVLALSRSRGADIAFTAAALAWVAAGLWGRWRGRVAPYPRWAVLAAVLGVLLTVESSMARHVEAPASLNGRAPVWTIAAGRVTDHPWFGYGPGRMEAALPPEVGWLWRSYGPHNTFLDALLGTGGVGAACYAGFVIALLLRMAAGIARGDALAERLLAPVVFWMVMTTSESLFLVWPRSCLLFLLAASAWLPPLRPGAATRSS